MTTKLVTVASIKKALKLKGITGDILASLFICITGLNRINKLYGKIKDYQGREFTAELLKELDISFEINEKELEYIPQEGSFIVTSNHPYGAIDGVILLHVFSSVRPDIQFLSNFILSQIPNLASFLMPVNPFSDRPGLSKSFTGLRMAAEKLKNGGAIALFPSGEVSTNYGLAIIKDKEWQKPVLKLVQNSGVPVVPVYFHGTNSRFFHWIGKLHPLLRTLRLPGELLNKKGRTIRLCIGRPVTVSEIAEVKSPKELGKVLRARSYALEANIPQEVKLRERTDIQPIALPKNRKVMQKELNALPADKLLFTTGNYNCYLVSASSIPLLMHEVGRRREEAFRAVGEGTGRPLDLDQYDNYYLHLILWDRQKLRLVGAYRLGIGSEIMKSKGVKGFYSQSLFGYESPFTSILEQSMELGRSFVVLDYQKEALPLVLLIKGLIYAVVRHKDVKYLLGPVSISSWYPKFYRSLIVYYLRNKHSAGDLEKHAVPRNPFFPDYLKSSPADLLYGKMDTIEKFDRFMLRISNNEYRLPTLVKKYLKINCKIVNYNVDPDFNYCVDGLVLLDLENVARNEIENLTKGEKERAKVLERFGFDQ